jgi:hypothetical protein
VQRVLGRDREKTAKAGKSEVYGPPAPSIQTT